MYDNLFLSRMAANKFSVSRKVYEQSNLIMDKTFDRDPNYKIGKLYDVNGNYLEDVDFKYQYTFSYSVNKDKVEFLAQFRPFYHPEIKYLAEDGIERLGFYLDVPNDLEVPEKWLIFGRNDTLSFTRYNMLKCNWTFKWIADGKIQTALGCLRNRNNYNSGVWSDGFVTSVENQSAFFVPSNDVTKTINYDTRFMISDNKIHPRVYEVSKIEDTFPPGIIRVVLIQTHFDPAKDNVELGVCNYYNDTITPITPQDEYHLNATLSFNGANPYLTKAGRGRVITAIITDDFGEPVTDLIPEYSYKLNGEDVTVDELVNYEITVDSENPYKQTIKAKYDAPVGDIITVIVGDKSGSYYDDLEVEVKP